MYVSRPRESLKHFRLFEPIKRAFLNLYFAHEWAPTDRYLTLWIFLDQWPWTLSTIRTSWESISKPLRGKLVSSHSSSFCQYYRTGQKVLTVLMLIASTRPTPGGCLHCDWKKVRDVLTECASQAHRVNSPNSRRLFAPWLEESPSSRINCFDENQANRMLRLDYMKLN